VTVAKHLARLHHRWRYLSVAPRALNSTMWALIDNHGCNAMVDPAENTAVDD
jgi:hypothetical protein